MIQPVVKLPEGPVQQLPYSPAPSIAPPSSTGAVISSLAFLISPLRRRDFFAHDKPFFPFAVHVLDVLDILEAERFVEATRRYVSRRNGQPHFLDAAREVVKDRLEKARPVPLPPKPRRDGESPEENGSSIPAPDKLGNTAEFAFNKQSVNRFEKDKRRERIEIDTRFAKGFFLDLDDFRDEPSIREVSEAPNLEV